MSASGPADHWDAIWTQRAPTELSWYQREPAVSLDVIAPLGLPPDAVLLDVGGGASTLVDALLRRCYSDISVLDIADAALAIARHRLGPTAAVHWIPQDLLTWQPARAYDLWHDRAVFHFLVDPVDRRRYRQVLRAATRPGSYVVIATFAADGPERCSGLPVARYNASELVAELADVIEPLDVRREEHRTPRGIVQPFTWLTGRIIGSPS